MKHILTTTALGSALLFGTIMGASLSPAQDSSSATKQCIGENCPGQELQNEGNQGKKRLKGVEQNNQGGDESGDQILPRKKRAQGTQNDDDSGDQGDQMLPRKKRAQGTQQNDQMDVNVDVQVGSKKRVRNADWKFDSNRHQRRRSKDTTFRFYLGGYYYAQPYWDVYDVRPYRVSCGEGRAIVSERFNRVRVVECRGGTYTYMGRRQGDTFRILLNSRTGRIVGRALI